MDSPISPQLKRHLLLNCWVLQERLDAAPENGCEIKKGLLSSWKDTVSPAFPEKFNNRLKWSGYNLRQAAWAIDEGLANVRKLLKSKLPALRAVSGALMSNKSLNHDQVVELIRSTAW